MTAGAETAGPSRAGGAGRARGDVAYRFCGRAGRISTRLEWAPSRMRRRSTTVWATSSADSIQEVSAGARRPANRRVDGAGGDRGDLDRPGGAPRASGRSRSGRGPPCWRSRRRGRRSGSGRRATRSSGRAPRDGVRWGSAARVRWKTALRFVPMMASQSSSVVSTTFGEDPDAGVVHEDLQAPEAVHRRRHRRGARRGAPEVAGEGDAPSRPRPRSRRRASRARRPCGTRR